LAVARIRCEPRIARLLYYCLLDQHVTVGCEDSGELRFLILEKGLAFDEPSCPEGEQRSSLEDKYRADFSKMRHIPPLENNNRQD